MAVSYEINLVNLIETFHSEDKCRDYLEALRWPEGVCCPRCEDTSISDLSTRNQYECNSCRYQFSVTSGTIMHDTHLPLWKWFLCVYMIVESKKAISANQIKRMIQVSYKTAWYLCHRIREALLQPHALLMGVVEIDETFLDAKPKAGKGRGKHVPRGDKTLLMGAIERDGNVQIEHKTGYLTRETFREFLKRNISEDAGAIYSDEHVCYGNLSNANRAHERVQHGDDEWARDGVHTNSIEGVWGLFKRSIIGSFHHISKKHLDRYIDEFQFRFNNRNNPYIFRDAMQELLTCGNLEYKDLIKAS